MLVIDNLDINTKRRHMTKTRQNVDRHLTHVIAVKNRIHAPKKLIGLPATKIQSEKDIDLTRYFPGLEDEQLLRHSTIPREQFLIVEESVNFYPDF